MRCHRIDVDKSVPSGAIPVYRGTVRSMAIRSTTASRRACFLVIGNHQFRVGISEPLYTLRGYFSRHCDTFLSETFVPGELNVLIDEFSNPAIVAQVRNLKARDPDTRLVVMATEFVTELRLLKFRMTNTFNYFAFRDDYRQAIEFIANRVGLRSAEPYMLARYKGFLDVLP